MSDCAHLRPRPGSKLGLGDSALDYAAHGFAVLPLVRGGKKPHQILEGTRGVHVATTDEAQIRQWWGTDPAANIGVRTGEISHLIVTDLDVKNGKDGRASLAAFMLGHRLSLPVRFSLAHTPSGGQHIWLRWPWAGWQPPERPDILPGVDIKGTGGYVVAPPSALLIQPIGRDQPASPVPVQYQFMNCPLCYLPEVPAWMAGWIWNAKAGPGKPPDEEVDEESIIARGAERGSRNVTYYKLACRLWRRHGLNSAGAERVREGVYTAWRNGDTTGMGPAELETIIRSAYSFINGNPGKLTDEWAVAMGQAIPDK